MKLRPVGKPYLVPIAALICLVYGACSGPNSGNSTTEGPRVIAFGSCNRQHLPQPLWKPILAEKPDLWIWLGDNIYADTHDMKEMAASYDLQYQQADYRKLRQTTPVVGIWDDHDYGINDGGKNYSQKDSSQQLLLDFLDVPKTSPRRSQKGAYAEHIFGSGNQKVKLLLLDARYNRDTLLKVEGSYLPNEEGTLLGEAQWEWLEASLENSDAAIHILACGIQFLPEEHRFEKWANFPKERERLLKLIEKTKPGGTVLISGDRHLSEVSKVVLKDGYPLYEITSSGLTHVYSAYSGEPNRYRQGVVVSELNYGLLTIDWVEKSMYFQIKGQDGRSLLEQKIAF